jgi:hypothetical protein
MKLGGDLQLIAAEAALFSDQVKMRFLAQAISGSKFKI